MDTTTTMFLVPGLGFNVERIRFTHGFINGYLRDAEREPYENSVYLLFKPKNLVEFESFVRNEYLRTKDLVEDYDYKGGYVVMVYGFPAEFLFEYKLFLKGKYSKFREKYIVKLPAVDSKIDHNGDPFTEHSLQFMICYKAKALRDYWEKKLGMDFDEEQEFWSKPVLRRETLYIDKITDYDKRGNLSEASL